MPLEEMQNTYIDPVRKEDREKFLKEYTEYNRLHYNKMYNAIRVLQVEDQVEYTILVCDLNGYFSFVLLTTEFMLNSIEPSPRKRQRFLLRLKEKVSESIMNVVFFDPVTQGYIEKQSYQEL